MSGGVVGGLIGLVIAISGFDVNLLQAPSVFTQTLVVAGSAVAGGLVLGPVMKKLFNSPEMHIWHHSYNLPEHEPYGINFGITLAIWDYIFKTAYIPFNGRDIRLGFPGIEQFPRTFFSQAIFGFSKKAD